MTPEPPKTLLDACRYYESPKVCFETMLAVKWPDGKICCPKCGGDSVGVIRSRSLLQCKAKDCRKQFSVKVDTIFEDSPLGHMAKRTSVYGCPKCDTDEPTIVRKMIHVWRPSR